MVGTRGFRTAAVLAGTVGGLSGATYGLLTEQAKRARNVIGVREDPPLNADGVYLPDGNGPVVGGGPVAGSGSVIGNGVVAGNGPVAGGDPVVSSGPVFGGGQVAGSPGAGGDKPLRFAVFGDSSAAGLGVDLPNQLPGVLLARGLAEEADRPVRLTTYAISGSTTRDLAAQVDLALADRPDVALVIIGANDVTDRLSVRESARLLGVQLARLRSAGVAVVAGTCPDLGAIRPIPQPLRAIAKAWSLLLAKAQRVVVERTGCVAVSLAALLSPEFFARPGDLFSPDRFHPNAAGYEAAASVLLAPVCAAAGVWTAERARRSQQERADLLTKVALAAEEMAPPVPSPLPSVGPTLATP
ncbi:MAG TPA: SGNH/GDSL hydrolase family protein [Pseudonocardiaceae bacterium]|nr:SGNH/GDSL hydrolase family protein [Pseudonocardiaceae bacterium]